MKPLHELPEDALAALVRRALHELPEVPPHLQQAAVAAFQPAPQGSVLAAAKALGQGLVQQAASGVVRVLAALSFDSWAAPAAAAAGMRSLRSPTRHLLFSAEGRDVDLRIEPAAGSYVLSGQVLGPDETGRVQVAGAAPHSAELDALGGFRIEGVAAGDYELTLHFDGQAVVLPRVQVGPPPPA